MKIIFFITGLGMGGAEKVVCELADKLYEKGNEISIVYFTGNVLRRPSNNIEIKKFPLKMGISSVVEFKKLLDYIKDKSPDVIHAHMFHANIMARMIKFFYNKVRVICTSHSNYEGGALRMKIYALTESLCEVHTNVSENAAQALMKAGAVRNKEIIPIYNGINTENYSFTPSARIEIFSELKCPQDSKLILSVGRIDTPKDYPNLLRAFKKVLSFENNVLLVVVGDGPRKEEIIALSQELGIQDFVKFLGIRNDIVKLLSACDVFVSSSAWEGFGLAILEAMLCKRPIVATKTDGAQELLPINQLVECGNYSDLADHILRALNDPIKYFDYYNAYTYEWSRIVEKWMTIYEG